jgi:hypothetical protein
MFVRLVLVREWAAILGQTRRTSAFRVAPSDHDSGDAAASGPEVLGKLAWMWPQRNSDCTRTPGYCVNTQGLLNTG